MDEGDLTCEWEPAVNKGDWEPMNTDPPIKTEDPDLDLGFPFFNRLEDPIDLTLDVDDFGDEDDVRTMTPLDSDSDSYDIDSDSHDIDSDSNDIHAPSESLPEPTVTLGPKSQPEPTVPGTLSPKPVQVIVIEDLSPEPESLKSHRPVMKEPTPEEEVAPPTPDPSDMESDSELAPGNSLISNGMRLRRLK
jgi:hypothetical protein